MSCQLSRLLRPHCETTHMHMVTHVSELVGSRPQMVNFLGQGLCVLCSLTTWSVLSKYLIVIPLVQVDLIFPA